MTKLQFLLEMNKKLEALPQQEAEEYLSFYTEMIEDRMEEGLSEADAVASVGTTEEIATQILAENAGEEKKTPPQKRKGCWVLYAWLGAPLWVALLCAAVVILALYISGWSVILSLWSVFAAFCAGAFAGLVAGIVIMCSGSVLQGLVLLSGGLICTGLGILWFFLSKVTTKGFVALTGILFKQVFGKKEVV